MCMCSRLSSHSTYSMCTSWTLPIPQGYAFTAIVERTQWLCLQAAISSRDESGCSVQTSRPNAPSTREENMTGGSSNPRSGPTWTEPEQWSPHASPHLIAVRANEPLPEGYLYAVRDEARHTRADPIPLQCAPDTIIVSPPTRGGSHTTDARANAERSRAAARRNLTKSLNKKANSAFAKEMKESLATGRPVTLKFPEGQHDLKARWHAAAKEVAYQMLDLRKEGWKDYTLFEKGKVHKELKAQYHFDPPIDPRKVDKYLAGHLRTSKAVWKSHWLKYDDNHKHPNCPAEAWETLIKWWPTDACREEAQKMAGRRSKVQNANKAGPHSLIDRMDDQVR